MHIIGSMTGGWLRRMLNTSEVQATPKGSQRRVWQAPTWTAVREKVAGAATPSTVQSPGRLLSQASGGLCGRYVQDRLPWCRE